MIFFDSSEENPTMEEPEQPMEGIRRPKQIPKAASLHTNDQRAAQFGEGLNYARIRQSW